MQQLNESVKNGNVSGTYDSKFEKVAQAFIKNFNEYEEVGASVCMRLDGEPVVNLWGGRFAEDSDKAWEEDTVSIVFSCTKAATALCAHLLIDRGELDLHAPVAKYWPEFGKKGKEKATVLMMLNHSVGLPAFREPIKEGGYYDWDYMIQRLEDEEPFWEPGIRNGYHMISFGWTVGELVRRVSGMSLGTFFRKEVAEPLGLEFWIGLPEEQEARVSHMIPFAPDGKGTVSDFIQALLGQPDSISSLSFLNSGGYLPDVRAAHAAEIGGGGGISNARSLSKMYVPLANGGTFQGKRFISNETITRMSQVSMATQRDATLLIPTRFALGFMKSMDNRNGPPGNTDSALLGDRAFGHVGAGGSIGFADPDETLAFSYTMNRMGQGLMLNERGQSLVDAAYRSLGYRTDEPGIWIK
ncbi:MAG: beta-lactamase family protein [Proteobacteria bacterium]|nr:beta-lactamase family protein [Pseudomonadota bacterium]